MVSCQVVDVDRLGDVHLKSGSRGVTRIVGTGERSQCHRW